MDSWERRSRSVKIKSMNDTELKALSAKVKKLTARVEALERLLQRIIQQKPVSERQLERALRVMRRSENASVR
jgi:DNA-binding SARP family transcriptional activator